MRFVRSGTIVAAVAILASVPGCGGGGGDPRGCGGGGECGATARCLAGTCVEDVAPLAVLAAPGSLEALALVELDGSASSDPDAALGDEIQAFRWSFTSLDDACDAPTVSGTDARARVRFACAGAFRVELVVVDQLGKESATVSTDLSVAPSSGNPAVVASADQSVNHVCSGMPRVCTTEGAAPMVSAQLAAGVEPVGTVSYHWTVDPPQGGPLDAHERVTFAPSADASSPAVHIDVDESAIAALVNDWILRVTAHDDAGPLGEATTRISVKNRPPVVVSARDSVSVDHSYSGGSYRATTDASRWSDPDGDPLTVAGSTGSSACPSVSFKADGTAVVQCVRAFSGAPGLAGFVTTHAVTVRASDPWAAADAPLNTAVTILNRNVGASSSALRTAGPAGSCSEGSCCQWDSEPGVPRTCAANNVSCSSYVGHPRPAVTDPDGNPVSLSWSWTGGETGARTCEPSACVTNLSVPRTSGCGGPDDVTITGSFTVTDGLSSGSGTLTVTY